MKTVIKKILAFLGYRLIKNGDFDRLMQKSMNPFTMSKALERLAKKGIPVGSVIDVGASNGMWSRACFPHFPESRYLLIEAQTLHEEGLDNFKKNHPGSDYVLKACGRDVGKIYFDARDPFGGLAYPEKLRDDMIELPVTTIDHEVKTRNLPGPYLIKLDTHGVEVPILEGAAKTLEDASSLIIEVYNFEFVKESLKFYEMCSYLEKKGFRPVDLVDLMNRSSDDVFWQMDIVFLKSDHPLFHKKVVRVKEDSRIS